VVRIDTPLLTTRICTFQITDTYANLSPRASSIGSSFSDNSDAPFFTKRAKTKWVPYKDLHNAPQQDFKVHVKGYGGKKSVSRRISSGIEKKPFFTFAVVGSSLLALNTYIVSEAMKAKEDKIMQLKAQKGELPVVIPDPPPNPSAQKKTPATKVAETTKQDPQVKAEKSAEADKSQGALQSGPSS
jgi:hypothetical protein